jgi:hypothetical protein
MTTRDRPVDQLRYEVHFRGNCVEEIRAGEDAWAFIRVAIHDRRHAEPIGTFQDFLYKNVDDMYRIVTAIANRERLSITHHDCAGNRIEVLDVEGPYTKIQFHSWGAPTESVWVHSATLQSTLVEALETIEVLVSGLNRSVAEKIDIEAKLAEVQRLV